jgi:outer membrane protein assembly factor BamB
MVAIGANTGTIFLLDAGTGAVLWSDKVAAGITEEHFGCGTHRPAAAIAAGDGVLAIPGGYSISVYAPAKE